MENKVIKLEGISVPGEKAGYIFGCMWSGQAPILLLVKNFLSLEDGIVKAIFILKVMLNRTMASLSKRFFHAAC